MAPLDPSHIKAQIRSFAADIGASDCRFSGLDVVESTRRLREWISQGYHGEMAWFEPSIKLRSDPSTLLPNAKTAIVMRFDYLPSSTAIDNKLTSTLARAQSHPRNRLAHESAAPAPDAADWRTLEWHRIDSGRAAVISVYARGRDYHKVIRTRLAKLATRINEWSQTLIEKRLGALDPGQSYTTRKGLGFRACVDSAPLFEVELARQAGLGWRGKHTLLLNREAGSMFFLGVLLTDLSLEPDPPQEAACGTCCACLDVCPTQAFIAPYQLDARRCISYLTIEHVGDIPLELRPSIGNRIYGCDDCQLVCPWNRYAQRSPIADFDPRHGLESADLIELFEWTEADFLSRTEGSSIRRIGFQRWQRNLAVAIGNIGLSPKASAQDIDQAIDCLLRQSGRVNPQVERHLQWALAQLNERRDSRPNQATTAK